MDRRVEPEILDQLPAGDPRAVRSRGDLRRINAIMGHARAVARVLRTEPLRGRIVELGAGDGTLLLQAARRLGKSPHPVEAVLVDRRASLAEQTRAGYERLGWSVHVEAADVFDWLRATSRREAVVLANLFLHHFHDADLSNLFRLVAERSGVFAACEPRRSRLGLAGVAMMPLIGCSAVTTHDGRISVRAGFRDRELSRLWPAEGHWRIDERPLGVFSHLFVARISTRPAGASVRPG